jgi:hypothetical protein
MLTIRQEQVDAFRQVAIRKFEDTLVEHLNRLFPQLAVRLGESGLRNVIQYGIRRAREYGIVCQRDVGRYIAVMLMFGPNFDQKRSSGPLYAVLRDPRFESPAARTGALCKAASQALGIRTRRTGKKPNW